MAKKLYPEENIQAIASAIRAKNGSSETYTIGEMAQAIEDIPAGDNVFKAGTIGTTFNGYKDIVEVNVPDGVTSIGRSAFSNCTSLALVYLPDSLTFINDYIFNACSSLVSITCRATNPPVLKSDAFTGAPATINIYVPAESVEAYKAANYWSSRASYIQAIPSEG